MRFAQSLFCHSKKALGKMRFAQSLFSCEAFFAIVFRKPFIKRLLEKSLGKAKT